MSCKIINNAETLIFDPFANQCGNYNICITGMSETEKSLVVQDMAFNLLKNDIQVFMIETGHFYKKFCEALNGEFIELSTDSQICLNPFFLANQNFAWEGCYFVLGLIAMMIAPNHNLTDLQSAWLEQAILEVWQSKGKHGSVTDVAAYLLASKNSEQQQLGECLHPYTTQGQYGHWFNGQANVGFLNRRLAVLSLEKIDVNPLLRTLVCLAFMHQVFQQMFINCTETRTTLILNEILNLLNHPQSAYMVESFARRTRILHGSLITTTNSIQDYFISQTGQAVFSNADWKMFLMQNKTDTEFLDKQQNLYFDPVQLELLRRIKTVPDAYSELVIFGNRQCITGRRWSASGIYKLNALYQQEVSSTIAREEHV